MTDSPTKQPEAKRAGPVQVAKAVFWSFLGIRTRAEPEIEHGSQGDQENDK